MDEDIAIINTNTRNEKIKNFLLIIKKKFYLIFFIFIIILIFFFGYNEYKKNQKIKISNQYNSTIIEY